MNDKKWVLVTGGSRGIGKGMTEHLAAQGYFVVFTFNSSQQLATELEESIKESGGEAKGYQCDGSVYSNVDLLCHSLLELYGAPYAVINNMGMTGDQLIYGFDIELYEKVIATNLNSAVYFNKCLIPAMSENREGKIVHISSVTGIKGNKGQMSYAATKAAMIGMTKTLSLEAARFDITVNSVAPGFIATDMVSQMPDAAKKKITKEVPLKRMGEIKDVSNLVEFLISEKASYITGQNFVVDGGLTA
ncbi:SDR family oxidoreductase [Alteromonas macleodii]|uniref:3-oxoacyl-ACP reductase n=1 Tax=Alteromonas macleodii TaxID=28108 RepID=A0A6T9Y9W8_ALTMA|nr:SDR family oxidoreductase [Alteromonas macleodii]CAB9495201.1 3-oxoacyl-ACP reductase [Alteromonas macleodii]